jgi:hypothetical protein
MKTIPLTVERLRDLLHFDPKTGVFSRTVRCGRIPAGAIAGAKRANGYVQISIDGRMYLAHRLAWLYAHGSFPGGEIDHINHERSDNRLSNLRDVSSAVNSQNQWHSLRGSSGHVGVRRGGYRASKWCAYIEANSVFRHLGCFDALEDAIAARRAAEAIYHPTKTPAYGGTEPRREREYR